MGLVLRQETLVRGELFRVLCHSWFVFAMTDDLLTETTYNNSAKEQAYNYSAKRMRISDNERKQMAGQIEILTDATVGDKSPIYCRLSIRAFTT
jgi:hypothetical protein